jgi:outer membrane receptor for ferrienterochelin and colicins
MKSFRLILLIVFCFIFVFKSYSQTIEVRDSQTQQSIPNVNIQWQGLQSNKKGGSITNNKGIAEIKRDGDNVFVISASCIGYKTYIDTVSLSSLTAIYLEEDIFNLEQVTVTGTRTPRTLKETPVLTQLVSRKDIVGIQARTINDILELEIPSVEMNNHGYGAALSSQGLEGKYTLVLIDGERMAGENDGNVDFSRINAANIERVEIVKGASSALYGSNAIGSVINIITKKPAKSFDFSASFRYTQPNEHNITNALLDMYDEQYYKTFYRNQDRQNLNTDLTIGFKAKAVYSQTYFGFKNFDAYQLFDTKETIKYYPALDSTVNSGVNSVPNSIIGFADYTISNKTGFTWKGWNGELRGNYYNHEEFDFERDNQHNIYSNYTAGGFLERNLNQRNTIKLSFNHDVYNKYIFNEIKETKEKNYGNTFNHFRVIYSDEQFTNHKLLFGAEIFNELLKSDRFSSVQETHSANDAVVIIQDEFSINSKTIIVGGLRSGYHSAHSLHFSPSLTIKISNGDF